MCWARRAWKNNIQSILTFRVAQWLKNKLLLRTDCKMEAVSQMSDTADVGSVSTGSYRDGTPGSGPLIITHENRGSFNLHTIHYFIVTTSPPI